jgi:DNA-binding NarL/FixJ family response regulator
VIVLSLGGRSANTESTQGEINLLNRVANQRPIILLADTEEPSQVVEALQSGTRGYIPTSVSLAIAIEAMRLVRAGGVYAPAGSVIAANCKNSPAKNGTGTRNVMFTERQTAILDLLCKGKPNKIIAYELGMCESTVKVHVRNIMKKLKATNRTQIAYLVRELMNGKLASNETSRSFVTEPVAHASPA